MYLRLVEGRRLRYGDVTRPGLIIGPIDSVDFIVEKWEVKLQKGEKELTIRAGNRSQKFEWDGYYWTGAGMFEHSDSTKKMDYPVMSFEDAFVLRVECQVAQDMSKPKEDRTSRFNAERKEKKSK